MNNSCLKCGGLIAEPGMTYGYSGKFCYCSYTESSQLQYTPNPHPKCECHQCTWLRASQMERAMIPTPIVIKNSNE